MEYIEKIVDFKYDGKNKETFQNYLIENGVDFQHLGVGGYSIIVRVNNLVLKVIPVYEDTEENMIENLKDIDREIFFAKELNKRILIQSASPHILKYKKYLRIDGLPYISDEESFFNFLEYSDNKPIKETFVLITEYADKGELANYNASDEKLIIYFFQVVFTLYVILEVMPGYRFGDLGFSNLFLKTDTNYKKKDFYTYKVADKIFRIPVTRYQVKFGDFGSNSVRNNQQYNMDLVEFAKEDGLKNIDDELFNEMLEDTKHNPRATPLELLKEECFSRFFLKDYEDEDEFDFGFDD